MVIFVTGTDTGVGKTVVTALLLAHLWDEGVKVRALKPFCSGERSDAELLWNLQERRIALDLVNPYYFTEPIAPWTAARIKGERISLKQVLQTIRESAQQCDILLVEGAGGLLSPLGDGFNARDLIRELHASVLVVAANRIGVINQVLLTCEALGAAGAPKIVLSNLPSADLSSHTNVNDLRTLLPTLQIEEIPRLEAFQPEAGAVRAAAKELAPVLGRLSAR